MKQFINPNPAAFPQQGFHITRGGLDYFPHVEHATLQEVSRTPRPLTLREHAHADVYHLVLYTQGQNEIGLNGKRVPAGKGVLVPTAPGVSHTFGPLKPGQLAYHEITFSLRSDTGTHLSLPILELLGTMAGVSLPPTSFPLALDDRLYRDACGLFERLLNILRQPHVHQPLQIARTLADILTLTATFLTAPFFAPSFTTDRIGDICAFIKAHCGAPLDIAGLATRAGMSRATFGRKFRARTGVSPLVYRNGLRVEAAKNLLRTTSLCLEAIATRLGYCDAYHFGRAFKQAVGLPPGRFRKEGDPRDPVSQ